MSGSRKPNRFYESIAMVAIAIAGIAAYSNTFQVPFLFDDIPRILEEQGIRNWLSPLAVMKNTNRPFAHYTFALNYAIHGYDVWGYHATNLIIHLCASWVLFGIVRQSLLLQSTIEPNRATVIAFFSAVLWCVHPLNTQAVTYIVQRLESLMSLCYLLTLYCFICWQANANSRIWAVLSILACAIGMGCKEVMVTAPIVVLWYDHAFIATSWKSRLRKRWCYYAGLACTWVVLVWAILHYSVDYTSGALIRVPGLNSWTYLLSQSTVIVHYLRLAIWPSGQCVYASWPIATSFAEVWPQFTIMILWATATLWCAWRRPRLGFLLGSFLVILAPTSSVVPIKDLIFEHRMYLPLTVLSVIAVAWVAGIVLTSPRWNAQTWATPFCIVLGIAATLALGSTTYLRNQVYQSELSVWTDSIEKSPKNTIVWVGLGGIHAKAKDFDRAKACFVRALEIDPNNASAHAQYAGMLIELQDFAAAKSHLDVAFRINPHEMEAISNMGHLLFDTGNFQDAVTYYEAAIQNHPENTDLRLSLAAALSQDSRFIDAVQICEALLNNKQNSSQLHTVYASSLVGLNRTAEAIAECERAIRLEEQNATSHAMLATLIVDNDQARGFHHMRRAYELQPESLAICTAYADMLLTKHPREAISVYEAAMAIDPDHVDSLLRIAVAWEAAGEPAKGLPFIERVVKLMPGWAPAKVTLEKLKASSQRSPDDSN